MTEEKVGGLTEDQWTKIIAMRKVERDLSKNMSNFMGEKQEITISDVTRTIARDFPEIMKVIDEAIDAVEADEAKKKEKHG